MVNTSLDITTGLLLRDRVHNESVNTEHTEIKDKRLYVYAESDDYITNIDPESTNTPLQNALDRASTNGGGTVSVPGYVAESFPIDYRCGVNLVNRESGYLEIDFDTSVGGDDTVDLMDMSGVQYIEWPAVHINGPGLSNGRVNTAIGTPNGPFKRSEVYAIRISNTFGRAIHTPSSGGIIWALDVG